jgi:integrase
LRTLLRTVGGKFIVATIQRVKRRSDYAYRVLIRQAGMKSVTKTFNTKRLANKFVNSIEGDRNKLLAYTQSKSHTLLSLVIDKYISNEYKGTRVNDERRKLSFWLEALGDRPIIDITTIDINQAISTLPSHFKNATINRYISAISVVFSYACKVFGLHTNPVRNIPSLPENNERIRFLSEAERTRLFSSCRTSQWDKLYLLVLLAITTGARKGELTKLRWNDIDFDRRTAYVATTKNGQPKVLPLTDSVIRELTLFDTKDSSLIFASKVKEEVAYCFTKPWKKALEDAEIKDFRFHDLRHTCASYLAQSGASLLEIAEILGHKQISVTKRYAHLCIEHKSSLINRVLGGI